jgi:RimJ/RimL family protein N-acetyltransferase
MELKEYQEKYQADIANYFLTDEMLYFTGTPQENVRISQDDPNHHSILAFSNQKLVTFFVLDECPQKANFTDEKNALLLRSFSTDARHLRKGYGRAALRLLPDFVNNHFPETKQIVLAVNKKNSAAKKLYQSVGFIESGNERMGPKGPQYLLIFPL